MMVEALLNGVIIFFLTAYVVSRNIDNNGHTANLEIMSLVIALSIQIVFITKICALMFV